MARRTSQRPSAWPRRFMLLTGLVLLVVCIIAFRALGQGDIALAFPLFVGCLMLLVFEIGLLILDNRLRS